MRWPVLKPGWSWIAISAFLPPLAAAATIAVSDFADGGLAHWEERSFKGHTDYHLVQRDGRTVLAASSDAAASGLYRKIHVDLGKTPYLNWSWRAERLPEGLNERTKTGDDYAARVYVVFSGGVLFWRTRALNYVWSSNQPPGSHWPNAFTANAQMIAVERGPAPPGAWAHEKRDIRADYRRFFGGEVGSVDAVAIMTDTDNSGQSARAYYGDIFFTSR